MNHPPSRPLKVCLVAPFPPPYGGIAHWTQMISRHAAQSNEVQLRIVDTSPHYRAATDLGLWKRVVFGGLSIGWHVGLVVWHLLRGCRVIHLTTSGRLAVYRDLAVEMIARLFRIPVLYHLHFGRVPELARKQTPEWQRLARAMRWAHTVLAIDQATEATIRRHLPNVRLVLLANCVDLSRLPAPVSNGDSTHPRTAIFLGWVIPTKGINELVQAWAELRPPRWQLHIVGPVEESYRDRLVTEWRPENLEFIGECPHAEAMQRMATADVFVFPSYTEGFPNALVEAMALGKPAVASAVGAIPEMLGDECGILIPPRRVDALKEALTRILADEPLRRQLGSAARQRARHAYSLEVVFDRLLSLWYEAATCA